MVIYILIIVGTTILTYFAQKTIEKSRFLFYLVSVFVLLVPSFMAGCRSEYVGVDVLVYEKDIFEAATMLSSFADLVKYSSCELFFLLINYVASCFSDSLSAGLFAVEFTFILFGYIAIVRMRKHVPMWIPMAIFLFGYYNLSFNLMRQLVAMSFMLFAFTYLLRDNNLKKFFILLIISFFFHKTAPIAGLFFLYIFWAWNSSQRNRNIKTVVYVLGCVAVLVLFQILLLMISNLGGRFEHYLSYAGVGEKRAVVYTIFVAGDLLVLLFCGYLYMYRKFDLERERYILLMIVITDLMSQSLGRYYEFATRMSCYFCAPYMFLLPRIALYNNIANVRTKYVVVTTIIIGFCVIWLRMVSGTGNTIPHKSEILGIE